jgi:hypothetical protein
MIPALFQAMMGGAVRHDHPTPEWGRLRKIADISICADSLFATPILPVPFKDKTPAPIFQDLTKFS